MVDRALILAKLALRVTRTPAEEPLVNRLCHASLDILRVDGVALTVGYGGEDRVTLCTTNDTAARLEDLQEVLSEGPGYDAVRTGQRVSGRLPASNPAQWPMLSAAVRRQLDAVELLALPLSAGPDPIGVLTAHRQEPFSVEEQEAAQFLADAIGAAITRDGTAEPPRDPWLARSRVHMATGMVVAQFKVSTADALALLRAYAFAHDRPLNQVAEDIISRDVRLDHDPEGDARP